MKPAVHLCKELCRLVDPGRRFLKDSFEEHRGQRRLHPVPDDVGDEKHGPVIFANHVEEVATEGFTRLVKLGEAEA